MKVTVNSVICELDLFPGYATLAHRGRFDLFSASRNYEFDGRSYSVLSVAPSAYIPSVTIVKLKEI